MYSLLGVPRPLTGTNVTLEMIGEELPLVINAVMRNGTVFLVRPFATLNT